MERDLSPGYESRFRILESPLGRKLRFPEMDLKSLKLLILRAFGTTSNCTTRGSYFRPRNRLGNLHFWRGLQRSSLDSNREVSGAAKGPRLLVFLTAQSLNSRLILQLRPPTRQ